MRTLFLPAAFLVCQLLAAESPRDNTAAFIDQVTEHFKAWDQDGNGKLSMSELNAAAGNPKTEGAEAAAVAALKRAQNPKLPAVELTLENIVKLAKTPPAAAEGPNFPKMYGEGLSKVGRANRVLFASEIPQLSSLHQGRLGDCFCLAPLGAMLHRDPKQVQAMFHELPDGSGKCELVLGKRTVTVEMPTDTELALSSAARRDGIWVNLYEKAVGQVRNDSKPEKDRTAEPLDAVARGGSAGTILALITGHEITRFGFKPFKDASLSAEQKAAKMKSLREQLAAAVREKRLMTCGTITPTTPGLTPNHAYAILDYDEKTDAVQLWNPHGNNFTPKGEPGLLNGYLHKNGIASIPLADFVQQFSGMAFEQGGK
ncbi:MAG TPA: C2 family cysteine protease [Planctomycetota bacterium]|nr:C2 family cysteine protease [Planctomycetota bacterium]